MSLKYPPLYGYPNGQVVRAWWVTCTIDAFLAPHIPFRLYQSGLMAEPIYIVGTGGLGREVAVVLASVNEIEPQWELKGFIGPPPEVPLPAEWLGEDDSFLASSVSGALLFALGTPSMRRDVSDRYLECGDRFSYPNLISPFAVMGSQTVRLGRGNVVQAYALFTCDTEIGDLNYFNVHVSVGHDVRIGDFNTLNPACNVSGRVRLASGIMVGTGSKILEGLSIGEGAVLGAGAVVVKDVSDRETVVGVPARPLKGR